MGQPTPGDLVALMPFATSLGIVLQSASASQVSGSMAWAADRCTVGGVLHGGALMTLADSVGAVCAYLNLPSGGATSTIEAKTNFFRPVTSGHVHAVSKPLNVGRTVIVVQTTLTSDNGKLVAQTTASQAVLTAKES